MKITYDALRKLVVEELNKQKGIDVLLETPEMLAEKSIMKNKYPFKALYIFGPAGSGKSFMSKQLGIPSDFYVSNPDERIEDVFPTFGMSMKFAKFVKGQEKEASPIAKAQQTAREVLQNAEQAQTANMLAIANPIVFDTTGEDVETISGRIESLLKVGYDVGIFQIFVPTDVSVARDQKRDRTVGKPTEFISKRYEKEVLQQRGYYTRLAKNKLVTMLSDDIYANLFNLSNGELLPGITQDHVDAMKTKDGQPYTQQYAQAQLDQARSRMEGFLGELKNPTGETILAGMKALVKASDGKLGQNMLQIGPAVANGIGGPEVIAAAEKIAELGGTVVPAGKTAGGKDKGDTTNFPDLDASQRKQKVAGDKFGVDDPRIRSMKDMKEARLVKKIEKVLWKMLKDNQDV